MNPYTYRKRAVRKVSSKKKVAAKHPASLVLSAAYSAGKTVLGAELGTVIGLAMVIFAAGSVMSLASVVKSELAVAEFVDIPTTVAVSSGNTLPAVLGASIKAPITYQYYTGVTAIGITPASFDVESGKWDYEIAYTLPEGLEVDAGSVSVGSRVVSNSAVLEDVLSTDFILEPSTQYEVVVWSGPNKTGQRLASTAFMTEPAPRTTIEE